MAFRQRGLHYVRYEINGTDSVSALFEENQRRGIYVLEFPNGEFYVGQAENVVTRYAQHHHGHTNHDEAWDDVSAIRFMTVPPSLPLTPIEQQEICRFRDEGKTLRNRAGNLGHTQPSQLDNDIPLLEQRHWSLGDAEIDATSFEKAAQRPAGEPTKLLRSTFSKPWTTEIDGEKGLIYIADLALLDLAAAISCIPDAVNQEGTYWTVSDYPSTAGGRLLTLNVMSLEAMGIPRETYPARDISGKEIQLPFTFINLPHGTVPPLLKQLRQSPWKQLRKTMSIGVSRNRAYRLMKTDAVYIPTGMLGELLKYEEIRLAFTNFCLTLMRQNKSGLFRRWHSPELARLAYEQVPEILDCWEYERK